MNRFSKIILISLAAPLCSCSSFVDFVAFGDKSLAKVKMRVSITTYHKNEDKWTRQGKSSSGEKLINKTSAAVDPEIIPYGSVIKLPECDLELVAVDTGTDVKNKKSSRLRGEPDVPVVDIYFDRKSDAMAFCREYPMFMEAEIVTN